ncbi:30S ribosomal protein S2 [Candidatus Gracilibacteria bacterium]|nr:30S ribosomal protein S2 [Candidatus Gracilibacteria bacterium]
MDKKMLTEMFDNLLHIGNKTNYWNPKMKSYIYGATNGVHIIDLTQTVDQLESVNSQLQKLNSEGKKVLFVATKLQARGAFATLASDTGNFFVTEKWVPGLLTNFKTIKKRIATYLQLLKDSEGTGFDMLTKKEKASKMLELEKLDKAFRGLKEMKKIPDVIFVVDGIYEGQAVKEAKSLSIPCFSISNTNGNPFMVSDLIPANTNSVKSLDYLASALKDGFKALPKKAPAKSPEKAAPKVEKTSEEKKSSEK